MLKLPSRTGLPTLALAAAVALAPQLEADRQQKGSNSVTGTVLLASNPDVPVASVIVTATGPSLRAGRSTVTDTKGRFEIRELPDGNFKISAWKPGFLRSTYGSSTYAESGAELALAAGRISPDIRLTLGVGGVIVGTVRSSTGIPVAGVRVAAFARQTDQTYIANSEPTTTNELGQYRLYDLAPGTYLIATSRGRDIELGRTIETPTTQQNDALLRALEARAAPNITAGTTAKERPPTSLTLLPVFYPGVLDVEAAQVMPVNAATETVADVTWAEGRAVTLSGTVIGPERALSALSLSMAREGPQVPLMATSPFLARRPPQSGGFVFDGVMPGRYSLLVTARLPDAGRVAGGLQLWWAREDVTAGSLDVVDVRLSLRPAVRLRGRVTFDGGVPTNPGAMRLSLDDASAHARPGVVGMGVPKSRTASPTASGTFEFDDVIPGRYTISVASAGWVTISAVVGDRSVLDVPFDVEGNPESVVVTLTNRAPRLSGTLQLPEHVFPPSYGVLVFPTDRALRFGTRLRWARLDSASGFVLEDMVPGDYIMGAATGLDDPRAIDDSLLDSVATVGTRLSLRIGDKKVVNLKIATASPQRGRPKPTGR